MSKFYGQVFGAGKSPATRCGHDQIKVSAQSYDGSVIAALVYCADELYVNIGYSDESSPYSQHSKVITFEEFKKFVDG